MLTPSCAAGVQALQRLARAAYARLEPIRLDQVSHSRDIQRRVRIVQYTRRRAVACGFQNDWAPGSVDPDTPTTLRFCRSHTLHPLHGGNILDRNRSMGASGRLCIACTCVCMRVHVFLDVFLWVRIRQGAFIID